MSSPEQHLARAIFIGDKNKIAIFVYQMNYILNSKL